MADVSTTFSTLSSDAPNVYIAQQMIRLAEKRMVLGKYATRHNLPQRTGKTLRVVRYKRLALPTATLTEGTPPDAVALSIENVDVTVEQWGIVVLLTDVAHITTKHPALQVAIDRSSLAMTELLEREMAQTLLTGTQVFFGGNATSRATVDAADKFDTAANLRTTTALRNKGAADYEGGVYGGCLPPQMESDLIASDVTFKDMSAFANVRRFDYGEIGMWQGVRWVRGNFLPIFKGQATPDTAAESGTLDAGTEKPQVTAVDGGGTITSATNFKFAVVFRDKLTDYERHITQTSANIASAATGNNESFTVDVTAGTLTNYVWDLYMTAAGGAGSLFRVKSRQTTASVTQTTEPAGTEATLPAAPAATVEVFTAFVMGRDAWGRVELDGMSLQSYLTPPGASYSNPLAQGRKVGSKIMWKTFIMDNDFLSRIEAASGFSAGLPTG